MTNGQIPGQMSMFDQDTWYGRMFREHSAVTKEMTSDVSLKKQPKSQTKMPQFLDLRGALEQGRMCCGRRMEPRLAST